MVKIQEVRERARKMGIKPGKKTKTELIRSIQETEGNPHCFHTDAFSSCREVGCCWRLECGRGI